MKQRVIVSRLPDGFIKLKNKTKYSYGKEKRRDDESYRHFFRI